ncbi:hypothetical protein [Microcoleus sp.]|uniref:hypothetical protein n=1 Tax=Microcoleus sp. TaxID=44472 RepID=UPI00403E9554
MVGEKVRSHHHYIFHKNQYRRSVLMTHSTLPVCADGAPYIDRINRFSIIKKG